MVFQAKIDVGAGGTLYNQAVLTAAGASGNPATQYNSHPPSGSGATGIVIDLCADANDCSAPTTVCDVAASPHACVRPTGLSPTIGSATTLAGTPALFIETLSHFYSQSDGYDFTVRNSPGCDWKVELLADDMGTPGALVATDDTGDGAWNTVMPSYDSNSNGKPDFGAMAVGQRTFWVRVTPPASTAGGVTCSTTVTAHAATLGFEATAVEGLTVLPSAPIIGSPVGGGLLSTHHPIISGTGSSGASVTISNTTTGASYGPVTVSAGTWSYALTAGQALPDGSYTLSATQAQAGYTSTASPPVTFTIDTTPPSAPAITSPVTGLLTSAASLALLGATNDASAVSAELYDLGVLVGSVSVTNGIFEFTLSGLQLGEGAHGFTMSTVDAAGNRSAPSNAVSVTVDRTLPAAPTVSSVSTPTSSDPVLVTGTAEPGTTVVVFVDGSAAGTAVADGTGSFSIPLTGLAEGPHTFTSVATDPAGNSGTGSDAQTFTVDRTAPSAPVLGTPAADGYVNTAETVVTGTAEPGATVTLLVDGNAPVVVTAAADGTFCASLTLSDGNHVVTATASDGAGNVSGQDVLTFNVDTTPPAAPQITSLTPDQVVTSPTVTVSGVAEPGALVTVVLDGGAPATTTTLPDGTYSVELPAEDGSHIVAVTVSDQAGNTSSTSSVTISVDTSGGSGTSGGGGTDGGTGGNGTGGSTGGSDGGTGGSGDDTATNGTSNPSKGGCGCNQGADAVPFAALGLLWFAARRRKSGAAR